MNNLGYIELSKDLALEFSRLVLEEIDEDREDFLARSEEVKNGIINKYLDEPVKKSWFGKTPKKLSAQEYWESIGKENMYYRIVFRQSENYKENLYEKFEGIRDMAKITDGESIWVEYDQIKKYVSYLVKAKRNLALQ